MIKLTSDKSTHPHTHLICLQLIKLGSPKLTNIFHLPRHNYYHTGHLSQRSEKIAIDPTVNRLPFENVVSYIIDLDRIYIAIAYAFPKKIMNNWPVSQIFLFTTFQLKLFLILTLPTSIGLQVISLDYPQDEIQESYWQKVAFSPSTKDEAILVLIFVNNLSKVSTTSIRKQWS